MLQFVFIVMTTSKRDTAISKYMEKYLFHTIHIVVTMKSSIFKTIV